MKNVFVCSPYAGDIKRNTENAIKFCSREIGQGNNPFAPHLFYPQIISEDDPSGRQQGIIFGISMLSRCDEIHVYGDVITSGMRTEIEAASDMNIKIRFCHYDQEDN